MKNPGSVDWGQGLPVYPFGWFGVWFVGCSGGYLVQTHQACHPFSAAGYSFPAQDSMNARAAISLSAQPVFFMDLHQQTLIGLCPLTFCTVSPGIVSAAAYTQHLAHAFHIMLALMAGHGLILHRLVREKMFTAFFRISRSSSASANFRCKRRISARAASRSLGSR